MLLKKWHFVIILILMIEISNATGVDQILLISGIDTSKADQEKIQNFADSLDSTKYDAKYVPAYGPGIPEGSRDVNQASPVYIKDPAPDPETGAMDIYDMEYLKTGAGLDSPYLNGQQHYTTIYAHSGGTRTAVTALMGTNWDTPNHNNGVTADTLVLISPIKGGREDLNAYKRELQYLLDNKIVRNIIVYQSPVDLLPANELIGFQAKFDKKNPGIKTIEGTTSFEVKEPNLGFNLFLDAHKKLWYTALKNELGSCPPEPQNLLQKVVTGSNKQLSDSKKKLGTLGTLFLPQLSPPTSDTSGFSSQNKEGADVPKTSDASETSGVLYTDKRDNVWYIDIDFKGFQNLLWKDYNPDRNFYLRPPAPMYLPSGERNTYGYNFINLPGMEGNFGSDFINWVNTYLASIGSPGPSAGVGLLVDEGNGGGGW